MGERDTRLLRLSPQTIAWVVVLTSFVIFCIVCAAGTFGAYWFFFQSPTGLTVHLTVSRGAITVTLSDGTSTAIGDHADNLSSNAAFQTASNAEGYLTFEDPYSKQTIAAVFLMPNSSVRLSEATRPRFEWSQRSYVVLLNNAAGQFAVDIPSDVTRAIVLTVQPGSETGAVRLDQGGSYTLEAFEQYVKLHTEAGKGLLYAVSSRGWQVEAGMEGTLTRGEQEADIHPYPYQNIIVEDIHNTDQSASVLNSFGNDDGDTRLPSSWACANQVQDQNEPTGTWSRERVDQRVALHMSRLSQPGKLISHAETGCEFWFKAQDTGDLTAGPAPASPSTATPTPVPTALEATEQAMAAATAAAGESGTTVPLGAVANSDDETNPVGWDVTGYKSLSIRMKMKINFQDVNTCGFQGTECPVMILVDYYAANDPQVRVWRQGFYAVRPPDDTSLQRCDTCPHDHEQINPGSWYIYNSNDLFQEFLADKKPVSIVRIRVYSSGHQYDVVLADLAVLGGL
jgi:hypothetical protein